MLMDLQELAILIKSGESDSGKKEVRKDIQVFLLSCIDKPAHMGVLLPICRSPLCKRDAGFLQRTARHRLLSNAVAFLRV